MCRTEKRSLYNYFALKLETVRLNQSAIELIVQLESDYTKFVIQGLRESLLICFASTFSRVMTFSRYIGNSGLPDCFPYVGDFVIPGFGIQWNPDITECQGTGTACLL